MSHSSVTPRTAVPQVLCPWGFPGKNPGVGCHGLLQGIFPTQGLNPGLLHRRQILHHGATWEAQIRVFFAGKGTGKQAWRRQLREGKRKTRGHTAGWEGWWGWSRDGRRSRRLVPRSELCGCTLSPSLQPGREHKLLSKQRPVNTEGRRLFLKREAGFR